MKEMHFYILSLEKDVQRREKISKNMNDFGISYEFFNATDAKKEKIIKNKNSKLTNSEAACAKGHLDIYRKFLETENEYALIIEDDVSINSKSIDIFKLFLDDIEVEVPAIYILGGIGEKNIFKYFVGIQQKKIKSLILKYCYKSEDKIYGTCCYLINRKASENILKTNYELIYLADDWNEYKKKSIVSKFFIFEPSIFIHPPQENQSHIEQERINKKQKTENKFKKALKYFGINHAKHLIIFLYRNFLKYFYLISIKKISKQISS